MSQKTEVFSLDDLDETEQADNDEKIKARIERIEEKTEWIQEQVLHQYMAFLITNENNTTKKELKRQGVVFPDVVFDETGKLAWTQETFQEFLSLNEKVHEITMNRINAKEDGVNDYADFLEAKENDGEFAEILKTILREQGFMDGTTIEKQIYDAVTGMPCKFSDGTLAKGVIPKYEAIHPSMKHLRELMKEARQRYSKQLAPIIPKNSTIRFKNKEIKALKDPNTYSQDEWKNNRKVIVSGLENGKSDVEAQSTIQFLKDKGVDIPKVLEENFAVGFDYVENFAELYDEIGDRPFDLGDYLQAYSGLVKRPTNEQIVAQTNLLLNLKKIVLMRSLLIESDGKITPWTEGCGYSIKEKERALLNKFFDFLPIDIETIQYAGTIRTQIRINRKPVLMEIYDEKGMVVRHLRQAVTYGKAPQEKFMRVRSYIEVNIIGTLRGKNSIRRTRFRLDSLYQAVDVTRNLQRVRNSLITVLSNHQGITPEIYDFYVETGRKPKYFYIWENDDERNSDIRRYRLPLTKRYRNHPQYKPAKTQTVRYTSEKRKK